ncbi:MAG: M1 family metallopeptidase [Bacteroidia bacterium]|jgi:aminopeptidase N|nr:M1 family metallopeptidase [Bacteroidia bacterium]
MIRHKRNFLFLLGLFFIQSAFSQPLNTFTKYDEWHGKLNKNRSWFDVVYYDITIKVIPEQKSIIGSNFVWFSETKKGKIMQIDIHPFIEIDSIVSGGKKLSYERDSSVVLINMPSRKRKGIKQIGIYFHGKPLIAKNAPWDGGFIFTKDSSGNDWVGVAVQSIGASAWLPCKDHNSDEPDSIKMKLIVPQGLTGVSNGRLIDEGNVDQHYKYFTWEVQYPINPYNITVNVGKYALITDYYMPRYTSELLPLKLSYYVLDYNKLKAQKHFKQVHGMMAAFEKHFGPYPFWNDGYKLVETPYWGMEHQSCVSYGNDYNNNRFDFDFIIIHESAHEWFGNSISANDPAELWLHESFTTYAEAVYVEFSNNKEIAHRYIKSQRKNIENKFPMVGKPDVFYHHFNDNDVYYKGAWLLYSIRNMLQNDTLWFQTLRDYYQTFKYLNISTQQCIDFLSARTGLNLKPIMNHYLYQSSLPVFQYELKPGENGMLVLRYRFTGTAANFEMPLMVTISKGVHDLLSVTTKWREIDLNYFDEKDFSINDEYFLIEKERITSTK